MSTECSLTLGGRSGGNALSPPRRAPPGPIPSFFVPLLTFRFGSEVDPASSIAIDRWSLICRRFWPPSVGRRRQHPQFGIVPRVLGMEIYAEFRRMSCNSPFLFKGPLSDSPATSSTLKLRRDQNFKTASTSIDSRHK